MSMFHNKNYRPDKESWLSCYVAGPCTSVWDLVTETINTLHRRLIGGWYCEHCQCFHSRRIYRYTLKLPGLFVNQTEWEVCSVGKDRFQAGEWKPEQRNLIIDAAKSLKGFSDAASRVTAKQSESEEYYEDPEQPDYHE